MPARIECNVCDGSGYRDDEFHMPDKCFNCNGKGYTMDKNNLHKQFEKMTGQPVFLIDMSDLARYYNPDYVLYLEDEINNKKCKLYCRSYLLLQEANKQLVKDNKQFIKKYEGVSCGNHLILDMYVKLKKELIIIRNKLYNIWKVDFGTLTDVDLRKIIDYIEKILKEYNNEY